MFAKVRDVAWRDGDCGLWLGLFKAVLYLIFDIYGWGPGVSGTEAVHGTQMCMSSYTLMHS